MNSKEQDRANKVYNLTIELAQVVEEKKAAAGGFRDEVKRIQKEINDIVDEANAPAVPEEVKK